MSKDYWENVYQTKEEDQVSWYQVKDQKILKRIEALDLKQDQNIIDVGSGASILIDQLLEAEYKNLHVLDLSQTALNKTQARLAKKGLDSTKTTWLVDDVCTVNLPQQYFDLWHDRAVFHFLITDNQQQQYIHTMQKALKKGGILMLSTFAEDGPTQCSGLQIEQYNIDKLKMRLGNAFSLIEHDHELHITPWGTSQRFLNSIWINSPHTLKNQRADLHPPQADKLD